VKREINGYSFLEKKSLARLNTWKDITKTNVSGMGYSIAIH
jgi:hypothetical protein